jgi:hypothetical protein
MVTAAVGLVDCCCVAAGFVVVSSPFHKIKKKTLKIIFQDFFFYIQTAKRKINTEQSNKNNSTKVLDVLDEQKTMNKNFH